MRIIYLFSLLLLCSGCDQTSKSAVDLEVPPPALHVHTVYPGAHPPIYSNVGMTESVDHNSDFSIAAYSPEEKVLYIGY